MEMDNWIGALLMIALLTVGLFSGGVLFSTEKTIEVEVPGECEACPECEVCKVCETCEETIVEAPSLLDLAVEDFMKAVEDEEDEAGEEVDALRDYDFDEISVSKVHDDYVIRYLDDDEYFVKFDIRLKYDEDDEKSEKVTYEVKVHYEEDEDTKVGILQTYA